MDYSFEDWSSKNVFHDSDICPECGEAGDPLRFYTACVEMDGKRHWYSGHKYCIMSYVHKVQKNYNQKLTNKLHAHLLKKDPDDFKGLPEIDDKNFLLYARGNRYGKPIND